MIQIPDPDNKQVLPSGGGNTILIVTSGEDFEEVSIKHLSRFCFLPTFRGKFPFQCIICFES